MSGENQTGRFPVPQYLLAVGFSRVCVISAAFREKAERWERLAGFWAGFFSFLAPESQIFVAYKDNREMFKFGEGSSTPNPHVCRVNPLPRVISA